MIVDMVEYRRQYYVDHREHRVAQNKATRRRLADRNKAWIAEYLAGHPCTACPATEHLTFHHKEPRGRRPKVSRLVHSGRSLELILAEIDLCEVLCCSCHTKHHAKRRLGGSMTKEERAEYMRQWRAKNREQIARRKRRYYLAHRKVTCEAEEGMV